MVSLFDSNPLLFLLLAGASIVLGLIWLVFPIVVMWRLGDIRDHLAALRGAEDARNVVRLAPPTPPSD
jgi:hypothetical protein